MDRASSEFLRAISALNARVSAQMTLIQKLQRTSNYDEALADMQSQIDELRSIVDGLVAEDADPGFDVS